MKILLFMAKGVEILEAAAFIDVFGWNTEYNHSITEIVTCGFNQTIKSTFNVVITLDKLIQDINVDEYAALAIPGGFETYGFYEDAFHEDTLDLIQKFFKAGKPIASICVGALPVAKSGVLKDKKATTYHLKDGNRQQQLQSLGAILDNKPVVETDNIITSRGPSTAVAVALLLLEKLTSREEAQTIRKLMGFK